MAAIGSLVFCTDCGNLLEGSSGDERAILKCDVCGTENKGTMISRNMYMVTEISYWCYRYILKCYHNAIEAHCFPLSASFKTLSGTDSN